MARTAALLTAFGLVLGLGMPTATADEAAEPASPDAVAYAEEVGVDLEEAEHRLQIQGAAADLSAVLEAEEPEVFGGLRLEHTPQFRVVIHVLPGGMPKVRRHLPAELRGLVRYEQRDVSHRDLLARLHREMDRYGDDEAAPHGYLDMETHEAVLVFAPEDPGPRFDHGPRVRIERSPRPEPIAMHLSGGTRLAGPIWCTGGFTVVHSTGLEGLASAAHCDIDTYYNKPVTLRGSRYSGATDLEWYTVSGATAHNRIWDGSRWRNITRQRNSHATGTWACKYGQSTRYGCGWVSSVTYTSPVAPSGTCCWMVIDVRADHGDSGGPVFNGPEAWGIMHAKIGSTKLVAMQIKQLGTLGLRVKTS